MQVCKSESPENRHPNDMIRVREDCTERQTGAHPMDVAQLVVLAKYELLDDHLILRLSPFNNTTAPKR